MMSDRAGVVLLTVTLWRRDINSTSTIVLDFMISQVRRNETNDRRAFRGTVVRVLLHSGLCVDAGFTAE